MSNNQTDAIEPAILGKAKTAGSFIYSEPLKGDFAKQVYAEVVARVTKDFSNANAFNREANYRVFNFNDKTEEINGSSTFWALLTDMVLRQNGLWIPTLAEGRILDKQGRLSNGVYRDSGVVLYTRGNPNKVLAYLLETDAKKKLLHLPLVIPFKDMHLESVSDNSFGIQLRLNKDLSNTLSGEQVQETINGLDYKINSGLHRLDRDRDGNWYGFGWVDDLAFSVADGRVDRFCGEATRENLSAKLSTSINMQYDTRIYGKQKERDEIDLQLTALQDARAEAVGKLDSYFQ